MSPDVGVLARWCGAWQRRAALLALLWVCAYAQAAPVRELRVGVYANEPKVFVDANGQAAGIFVDLLQLVATREHWRLRFIPCEWQDCLDALRAGQLDLMPDVARTPEREQLYDFHALPVLHSWSEVYRAPGSSIHSLFDLQGQRVAVLKGSVQRATFLNMMDSFGVQVVLVDVPSYVDAFALVQRGGADAVIANHRFGNFRAAQYGLIDSGIVFQPAMLYFVAERGRNADVLAAIDRAAQGWRVGGDPAYAQVLRRWGGPDSGAPVSSAMGWGMAALGVAALLAGVWVVLLRRKVQERTQ